MNNKKAKIVKNKSYNKTKCKLKKIKNYNKVI